MNPFKLLVPGSLGLRWHKDKKKKEAERLQRAKTDVDTDNAARMKRMESGGPGNFEQGLVRGADLAKKDLGPEALQKAENNRSSEIVDLIARQKQQSLGLSAGENRALVDKAMAETQGATQGAVRAMRGQLAGQGVRGGAAVAAEAGQRMQGAANMGAANREIMINDIALKRQGLQNYGAALTGQRATEYEQAKDKLKTKIGMADMGQQNANLNEQLTAQGKMAIRAQEAEGGGSIFLCTELRNLGLMSREETAQMAKVFLRGVLDCPSGYLWYFLNGNRLVDACNAANLDWRLAKVVFVDDILATRQGRERSFAYLSSVTTLCEEIGFETPPQQTRIKDVVRLVTLHRFWSGVSSAIKVVLFRPILPASRPLVTGRSSNGR